MSDLVAALDAIEKDADRIVRMGDSIEYTFLPSIARRLRSLQAQHSLDLYSKMDLYSKICERITSKKPSIAWRPYLGTLRILLPIQYLNALAASPDIGRGLDKDLLPPQFSETVIKALQSDIPDVAETAISLAHRASGTDISESVLNIASSEDSSSRASALFYLSCYPDLARKASVVAVKYLSNPNSITVRTAAFRVMGASKDIDLLRSVSLGLTTVSDVSQLLDVLLDLQSQEHLTEVTRLLSSVNLSDLPDATLRRIRRNDLLLSDVRESAQLKVGEELSARFDRNREDPKFGCVVHRNTGFSTLWIGHAGIYIGNGEVVHCTTSHDPRAVHRVSIDEFITGGGAFWGYRRDDNLPDDRHQTVVDIALETCSWNTKYDGAHNNQKGEWFEKCVKRNPIRICTRYERDYWESDCVGFVEHCFERAGGNPTPNDFESGFGWPLTPREQRDHTVFVSS